MNAETLIKALKCCTSSETGCIDCPNIDLVTGRCSTELDTIAIDVIESLQAQLEQFNATLAREGFTELETMIAKYKTVILAANELSIETDEEIEALRGQLKESQRREKAAVEDLELVCTVGESCFVCKNLEYRGDDFPCIYGAWFSVYILFKRL